MAAQDIQLQIMKEKKNQNIYTAQISLVTMIT